MCQRVSLKMPPLGREQAVRSGMSRGNAVDLYASRWSTVVCFRNLADVATPPPLNAKVAQFAMIHMRNNTGG